LIKLFSKCRFFGEMAADNKKGDRRVLQVMSLESSEPLFKIHPDIIDIPVSTKDLLTPSILKLHKTKTNIRYDVLPKG
jgi:hypothetical protein